MQFHSLALKKTIPRIDGQAKTLIFDVPDALKQSYTWQAGQHITVKFILDGVEVRRSYTIAASPHTGEDLQITVKRVKEGLVSNYINDTLEKGMTIEVALPKGSFTLEPMLNKQRTHYFFGAGSGITPLWAMINTLLIAEPYSKCHLLYANHNDNTIIFKDECEQLQTKYPKRLTVSHILSKPRWTSAFKYWKSGYIDAQVITEFIQAHPPYAQDTQYYLCAPNALLDILQTSLQAIDVPQSRIHFETFGKPVNKGGVIKQTVGSANEDFNNGISIDAFAEGIESDLQVTLNNKTHHIAVNENQTLLDAMLAADVNAPYSCQAGVCGSCKVRLTEGEVVMRTNVALDDTAIAKGYVLSCQSVCKSAQVQLKFE